VSLLLATALGLSLLIPWYEPDRLTAGYFLLLILAVMIYSRAVQKQSLLTKHFLFQPVLWCSLAYFGLALLSFTYISPENKMLPELGPKLAMGYFFYQLLPLYLFAFGPVNLKDARNILMGLLPTGALNILLYLIAVFASGSMVWSVTSFQGFPKNVTGDITAIAAIASFGLMPTVKNKFAKYALIAITVLGSVACCIAFSKAAAASILVSVLLIVYMSAGSRAKRLQALAVTALLLGTLVTVAWQIVPNRLRLAAEKESISADGTLSIRGRERAATRDALAGQSNPIGWRVSPVAITGQGHIFNPCNLFFQAVIELGYIGAFCLLAFYIAAFSLFWRNFSDLKNGPSTAQFVNLTAFCIFLERFIRDMVDYHELTIALTLAPYACLGLAIFIRGGLDRRKQVLPLAEAIPVANVHSPGGSSSYPGSEV
jgi:hypothetical protein